MTLQVKIWADFAHVSEESDSETNEFQYKMFAVINSDDAIYYGELPTRKAETSTPARPKPFGGGPYHGSSCRTPTSLFRPYYGCRFRGGYKTGIVLGRHSHDLKNYLSGGVRNIDKKAFMNVLESAIYHLHSLGLAHNDLNPTNVLVDDSEASGGMPVLIDFGSAGKIGSLLGTSRGTSGWIEGRIEDYGISRKEHDTFALEKMRLRLDNPTFDDD
ncbi:hypothetical protein DTO013E5_6341 [Penicillium roqueforti]|nr:hypothetical protein CBS147337_6864 [Penicillium roqueforti]KAI2674153.1 hypothetical protein CBS147355_7328 [Penicillium roqueforti]KAI2714161.1 hypothetical protein CBS147318_6902 [Penicillium roqueforti]KAI2739257.1 hypothetical protein DTO012A1_6085 [Penicillium roqueforti]KAI2744193.1 hypothetical protein DTO012A8_9932 [Penicillium roqueforti]